MQVMIEQVLHLAKVVLLVRWMRRCVHLALSNPHISTS